MKFILSLCLLATSVLAGATPTETDLQADAEVFFKGAEWAKRYEESPKDSACIEKALARRN